MTARRGRPKKNPDEEPAPEPSTPAPKPKGEPETETEPPKPDAPSGKDRNPKLAGTRKQIASGAPWDPKRSKELAKQMPKPTLVKSWEPVAECFAMGTDVSLMIFFGPEEVLTKTGPLPEREQVIKAWAARLAIEPPENIKAVLNVNLVMVYAFIFLPRIQRAWAKKYDEENDPKCIATAIKRVVEDRRGKQETKQARKAPGPVGDVPQEPKGDEGRGPGSSGGAGTGSGGGNGSGGGGKA